MNGFSFCSTNKENGAVLDLQDHSVKEFHTSPQKQLEHFESLSKELSLTKEHFESVDVVHVNELCSLVPKPFFKEEQLALYLKHNLKVLDNDFITFDEIEKHECSSVYIPFVNINNYIFEQFGSFEFRHISTLLLEQVNSTETSCTLNIYDGLFQLLILKNNKIAFFNTFNFKTKEDFLYYVLFTCEQLKIDSKTVLFQLTGNIEPEDEVYTALKEYTDKVEFLKTDKKLPLSTYSRHQFYTLTNQYT